MVALTTEQSGYLRGEMLAIACRDGFDKCEWDAPAVARIAAKCALPPDAQQKWARTLRARNPNALDMEMALRMPRVYEDDLGVVVGNCFVTGVALSEDIVRNGPKMPKVRAVGEPAYYTVYGHLAAWNAATGEVQMLLCKAPTAANILFGGLLRGMSRPNVKAYSRPQLQRCLLLSVQRVLAKAKLPGFELVRVGDVKALDAIISSLAPQQVEEEQPVPAAAPPKEERPQQGAPEEEEELPHKKKGGDGLHRHHTTAAVAAASVLVATNASLLKQRDHLQHLTFVQRGQMGAATARECKRHRTEVDALRSHMQATQAQLTASQEQTAMAQRQLTAVLKLLSAATTPAAAV